jgi:hypothetical protein
MNRKKWVVCFLLILFFSPVYAKEASIALQKSGLHSSSANSDLIAEIKELLNRLAIESDNTFFQHHLRSIITVLDDVTQLTKGDSLLLEGLYTALIDTTVPWNTSRISSYLERKRPFILSWTSPADGTVSLAWLIPPENWNPDLEYPLYVRLHGLSDFYGTRIQYLTRYLGPTLVFEGTFEDGYTLLPWGRGNLWYQGIAETDVWESIDATENYIHVNPARKYLTGMSMGGYGAWSIGAKSHDAWAALGIYAAALWYGGPGTLNPDVIDNLKDVPVFFICGTSDGLLAQNQQAYQMLDNAGNPNLAFETFAGGHESLLENWQKMYAWIRNFTNDRPGAVDQPDQKRPSRAGLIGNYPNPFNSETLFRYEIQIQSNVQLTIYNPTGQKIRSFRTSLENPGEHDVRWDGRDDSGMPVPSGVYFCCMLTKDSQTSLKILMLK